MIRIFSDSTCDLSPELVERYHITVIPLLVVLDEKAYKDGVEINEDMIFSWADENKKTPKTSAPSVDDVMSYFKPAIDAGDESISFSISESMSNSINVQRLAAKVLEAEDRISVVDSANLSTGIGLLILEACDMAEAGKSREEIIAALEELKPKVRASFVVDTLTYLYRGGRCSGLAALVGGALRLHPEIVVSSGAMAPSKKYRGKMSVVYKSYAADLLEAMQNARKRRVFVTHTCIDREGPELVKQYVESLGIFEEVLETKAGGVVTSHCGPGTLGVLFISN